MPAPSTYLDTAEYGRMKRIAFTNQPDISRLNLNLMDRNRSVKDLPDGSRTVIVKNAAVRTMGALQDLRSNRNLCDVVFHVGGSEILAHRSILIINSNYFHSMFIDGFQETLTKVIQIPSHIVSPEAAESLIDFMYSGSLAITSATVQALIVAADHWEMAEAKEICVDFMERQIDSQNCLGVLSFSQTYHCDKLISRCMQIIKQQFTLVVECTEFLHLSTHLLEYILDLTDLALGNEGEDLVLKALFRWVDFSPASRAGDLPSLLRKVHLSLTSKGCRLKVLGSSSIVQENDELRQMVKDMLMEHQEARSAQVTLYVIGGFTQSRTGPKCPRVKGVERMDAITNKWTPCADFPILSSGSFAFSIHRHLFCAAFEPINTRHANVILQTRIFEYDHIHNQWFDAQEFFTPEALECIDNCLQAEGALAVCSQTNTVYTVSRDEMCRISFNLIDGNVYCKDVRLLPKPMLSELFSQHHRLHSALVLDGRLYVLGGDRHDAGTDPVATARVIMFDPNTDTWVARRDMTERRAMMGAVVLNGKIYVTGGFNTRRLESVECYDPANDAWETLSPMMRFRTHHHALVMDNKIWAIGGKSYAQADGGARNVVNMCEIYDPQANIWTEGPAMKSARCGFAAVAM